MNTECRGGHTLWICSVSVRMSLNLTDHPDPAREIGFVTRAREEGYTERAIDFMQTGSHNHVRVISTFTTLRK